MDDSIKKLELSHMLPHSPEIPSTSVDTAVFVGHVF